MTRLSDFDAAETITVTPMRTFPVIRDLVTDVSFNYEKARSCRTPTSARRDADGKRRMAQVDVERGQEFRKCIECFLCQNVCHVVRDHEDNKPQFAGPRFFLRYAELDMHPLDTTTGASSPRSRPASACATSPSAAPRSAPRASTSPTTRSSR